MNSIGAVIDNYFDYGPPCQTPKGSVICDGDQLQSYGPHFILCQRYIEEGKPTLYLANSETYSPSTSKHQLAVRRVLYHRHSFEVAYPESPQYFARAEGYQWEELMEALPRKRSGAARSIYHLIRAVVTLSRIIRCFPDVIPPALSIPDPVLETAVKKRLDNDPCWKNWPNLIDQLRAFNEQRTPCVA